MICLPIIPISSSDSMEGFLEKSPEEMLPKCPRSRLMGAVRYLVNSRDKSRPMARQNMNTMAMVLWITPWSRGISFMGTTSQTVRPLTGSFSQAITLSRPLKSVLWLPVPGRPSSIWARSRVSVPWVLRPATRSPSEVRTIMVLLSGTTSSASRNSLGDTARKTQASRLAVLG